MVVRTGLLVTAVLFSLSGAALSQAPNPANTPNPPTISSDPALRGNQPQSTQPPGSPAPETAPAKTLEPLRTKPPADESILAKARNLTQDARSYLDLPVEYILAALALGTFLLALATTALAWWTRGVQKEARRMADHAAQANQDIKGAFRIADRTAQETSRAAQAAVEAANADRAWLSFDDIIATKRINAKAEDGNVYPLAFGFAAKWTNTGRSPSLSTAIVSDSQVIDASGQMPSFAVKFDDANTSSVFGPSRGANSSFCWIYGEDLRNFINRTANVYFYSKVEYGTIRDKDKRHNSEVCVEIKYNGDIPDANGNVNPGFDIRRVGKQNSAT